MLIFMSCTMLNTSFYQLPLRRLIAECVCAPQHFLLLTGISLIDLLHCPAGLAIT